MDWPLGPSPSLGLWHVGVPMPLCGLELALAGALVPLPIWGSAWLWSQQMGSSHGLRIPLHELPASSPAAHHKYSLSLSLRRAGRAQDPSRAPACGCPGAMRSRVCLHVRVDGSAGLDRVLGGLADRAPGPRPLGGPAGSAQSGSPCTLPAHEAEAGPPSPQAGRSPPGLCGLSRGLCLPRPRSPPCGGWGPQRQSAAGGWEWGLHRKPDLEAPEKPQAGAEPRRAGRVGRGLRACRPSPSEPPHTQPCLQRGMAAPRLPSTPGRADSGGPPQQHLQPSPASHPLPPTSTQSG